MANQKISELNSIGVGGLDDSDLFVLVDSSATETKHITWASIKVPPFIGCRLGIAVNTTGIDFTAGVEIVWDVENDDTHGFHDGVTNPNRITIPPAFGGMYFDVAAHVRTNNVTSGQKQRSFIRHWNAADSELTQIGNIFQNFESETIVYGSLLYKDVKVDSGDYFTVWLDQETDTSIDVTTFCLFSAKLIGQ